MLAVQEWKSVLFQCRVAFLLLAFQSGVMQRNALPSVIPTLTSRTYAHMHTKKQTKFFFQFQESFVDNFVFNDTELEPGKEVVTVRTMFEPLVLETMVKFQDQQQV